jgi:hypothetical protein
MDTLFAITYAPWIMFVVMATGLIILFKQKRDLAIAITAILFFTLLGSSLKLYPSLERMVLFLIPIGILLIGKTLENIEQRLRELPIASTLTLIVLGGFVLYGPLVRTIEQFVSPKYFEHIRPSMDYLKEAWKDGDSIYISNGAVPAFEYYAPFYGLEDISYIAGQRDDYENPDDILQRLDPVKDQDRVWVLMSHVYERGGFNERDFLLEYLKQQGTKKREFREPGTSVYLYLYDLRE